MVWVAPDESARFAEATPIRAVARRSRYIPRRVTSRDRRRALQEPRDKGTGWMPPPDGIEVCQAGMLHDQPGRRRASMEKATIFRIDLAKRVFQVHAAGEGRPAGVAQEGVAGAVARLPG